METSFHLFLISQLSALIILPSIKDSVFMLICSGAYCVPLDIKMTERGACPSVAHSIQVEQNLSDLINQY